MLVLPGFEPARQRLNEKVNNQGNNNDRILQLGVTHDNQRSQNLKLNEVTTYSNSELETLSKVNEMEKYFARFSS